LTSFLSSMSGVRTIHVSNVPLSASQSELVDLFEVFGEKPRVELKHGFAFVGFATSEAAEKARSSEFDLGGRRLRCDFAKKDMEIKEREEHRANLPVSRVLFIVNYDTRSVTEAHLRGRFTRYGRINKVRCFYIFFCC
jgi:RNA recognition motif-containing protein